ncbi:hypothetical protein BDU57DRAFT_519321 [Ampelomyces quisqualis]|uniref:Uncharacterized protein n=1 Tax=Ampelomyces quisqualis TaxID=50730 RepID=A0A6A5QG61_AMPQU|nr:hypothetical protein BDU57DRAFT_519321 [Ampelomyces quisqualis]
MPSIFSLQRSRVHNPSNHALNYPYHPPPPSAQLKPNQYLSPPTHSPSKSTIKHSSRRARPEASPPPHLPVPPRNLLGTASSPILGPKFTTGLALALRPARQCISNHTHLAASKEQ